MSMDSIELMKIFDFILENKDIIFDSGLFNIDTLLEIRLAVKGKTNGVFKLTKEQCKLIIDTFKNINGVFTEDTPDIITSDLECIKLAVLSDVNSIDYIKNVDGETENYVIEEAIKRNYVLKKNSPIYLKNNFLVVLNSIRLDCRSADYIDWYSFLMDKSDLLVDEVLKSGYILTNDSNAFLKDNLKIVLDSLKKDINNIKFASTKVFHDENVFEYLIVNGYQFSSGYIYDRTLDHFLDKDVLKVAFRKINIYGSKDEKYIDNFSKMFNDAINSEPLIKTFESVFSYVAEQKWREFKKENLTYYDNIFGKICSELRNSNDFIDAIDGMGFLDNIQEKLGDRYELLYQAMLEYFEIYHSEMDDKLSKLKKSKDIISKMSALYVAKCKESYKKERFNEFYDCIKDYYTLNLDNPYIYKKVVLVHNKQQFRENYIDCYGDGINLVDDICKRYYKNYDKDLIDKLAYNFIVYNRSRLNDIILEPNGYSDWLKYGKAIKLVHRLNSGYIKYDGVELLNYRDIISFDEKIQQYVYSGEMFDSFDLKRFNEYKNKVLVFEKLKKDIMMRINSMEFDGNINEVIVDKLRSELPFNDEYFKFDREYTLECFMLHDLISRCFGYYNEFEVNSFIDDDVFDNVYNLMIGNGMMWLLTFMKYNYNGSLAFHGVKEDKIVKIINDMGNISKYAKEFKFDIRDYGELMLVSEISKCADGQSLAILGRDIIEKLCKHKDYTDEDDEEIVCASKELVCRMVRRDKSTVPYISGKYLNYNYSMYDSQDESILVSGIDTDSCFRIFGNDNDFLHYCALDKNGFVIKITDEFGNFIGRASGFRNGNCVFINQLRTIYDEGGNNYHGIYDNETNDIIETFKRACLDIVNTSLNNDEEKIKIEFIFVTQSYALDSYESNVPDDVSDEIGCDPMDTDSYDWDDFFDSTDNLENDVDDGYFNTDYGDYPLICMATSMDDISKIKISDIEKGDVPALYERKRNKIIVTNTIGEDIIRKVNKIKAIKSYDDMEEKFEILDIAMGATVFVGDNWYIVLCGGKISDSCLLDFDDKAKIEFKATIEIIWQHILNKNSQQINCDSILFEIENQNNSYYTKSLKK